MQNLAFAFWPQWHFAVAIGYENDRERILLHTGTNRAEGTHWNRFVRTWARADYRGMVVTPPGELPANAEPRELVRALNDLQKSAGPEAARPYWQTAVERWPDHYLVQFGRGNLQWALGEKEDAIQSFRNAVEIHPDAASAWHNLAEAWRQVGCTHKARKAIQKALELAPERDIFHETRDAIRAMPASQCSADLSERKTTR